MHLDLFFFSVILLFARSLLYRNLLLLPSISRSPDCNARRFNIIFFTWKYWCGNDFFSTPFKAQAHTSIGDKNFLLKHFRKLSKSRTKKKHREKYQIAKFVYFMKSNSSFANMDYLRMPKIYN